MIDLHNHILPMIDDGAKNWDDAISMAKEAVQNGIEIIVATPHHQNGVYANKAHAVLNIMNELNEKLQAEKIPLTVYPGNETHIYVDFVEDLKTNQFFTINNNKKYVYLELPFGDVPRFAEQLVYDIQLAGFIPIIPHPERNEDIRSNPMKLYQLVNAGALTQITSGSLLGNFGKDIQKFTYDLIDNNLTHMLATDAHTAIGGRGINLKSAYNALEEFAGVVLTNQFKDNTKRIFYGKDVYVDMPSKIVKKKKFFGII